MTTNKLNPIRTFLLLLMSLAFVLSTCAGALAQGRKMGGMNAFNNQRGGVEYGVQDDFVKLDANGRPVLKPNEKLKEAEPKQVTVYEDDDTDLQEEEPIKDGDVKLVTTIAVPHLKKALSQVTAYPYPMKPPVAKQKMRLLPDKDRQLKNMIMSSGYMSRAAGDIPYPPGGWRWQYAFNKAVKNSNLSMPHTIFEHYQWADRMIPYVKAQTKIYNQFERTRLIAYNERMQDFTDHRTEMEDLAVQRNLSPVPLKRVYLRSGTIGMHYAGALKPGKWWILATHRVPGLKYFWLQPVEIDKNQRVILNEANAVYVEGGW